METSRDTQLPEFKVERFHFDGSEGSYDMLQITCPRCGGEFWVKGSWVRLRQATGRDGEPLVWVFGRNCPYCPKVSAIPSKLRIIIQIVDTPLEGISYPFEYTLDRRLSGPIDSPPEGPEPL